MVSETTSAAGLRYQHVMTGRDAAIAAALDELIETRIGSGGEAAASTEWHASGTNQTIR